MSLFEFEFYIPPTPKVIRRRDLGLKIHPKVWALGMKWLILMLGCYTVYNIHLFSNTFETALYNMIIHVVVFLAMIHCTYLDQDSGPILLLLYFSFSKKLPMVILINVLDHLTLLHTVQ